MARLAERRLSGERCYNRQLSLPRRRSHTDAAQLSGPLAQLAEQQTLNLRVLGSIPRRLTTFSRFHSEISISAILGADLSRSKRPTDPVLSLLRLCFDFAPVTASSNTYGTNGVNAPRELSLG